MSLLVEEEPIFVSILLNLYSPTKTDATNYLKVIAVPARLREIGILTEYETIELTEVRSYLEDRVIGILGDWYTT
jgi:hypothetical protein